ncbi:MAG: RsmD family RNA methyltransferase [Spirochaetota bacterium]
MRISAGRYKGRALRCPSEDIRPVTAKMRESIFSMLYSRYGSLEGLRFLDVFCGSAVMSVEAASRGAAYVEAVDRDPRKKKILRENLGILDIPWKLFIADAQSYLQRISVNSPAFDIIYFDPPFKMEGKAALLESLRAALLRADSLVMIHLPKNEADEADEAGSLPPKLANGLSLESCRSYGATSSLCLFSLGG